MQNLLKKIALLIVVIFSSSICSAATCTATVTGNWESPGTWSCGHVPTCADEITIAANVTVTITVTQDYSACPAPMTLSIYGTLTFQTGKKLLLPAGSSVFIYPGGSIIAGGGGGSSNLISIGGTNVWTAGMGTLTGPASLGSGALPIELLSFTAQPNGSNVDVNWSTATENINDYFSVEKTIDGYNFVLVDTIKGAGNSSSVLNYSTFDTNPNEGVSYYRLKQTDYNGEFTNSSLVLVDFKQSLGFMFDVFPNPNDGNSINLLFNSNQGNEVLVVVYDMNGKETYSKIVIIEQNGDRVYSLDLSSKLSAGVYLITATSQQNLYHKKLIIQ